MAEYTEQVYNIVSRVAYLIGVEERIFKTDEEFVDSENGIRVEDNLLHQVYSELDGINSAKIFRSLNIIRMDIMRNYKEINMQIYYNLKNLDSLPEYVHQDALAFLQENGLVIPEPGKRPYDYTIKLTQLINRRVSEIVLEVFPVWINPDYLKKIFQVKCSSEKDAKLLIQRYNTRHNMYPYQTYLNLDTDCGNVLYNDEKFVHVLYEKNHDVFSDDSKVKNVSSDVKENLLEFMETAGDIYILVDCENTDVYKLYSMLSAMRQDYPSDVFQKIKKIELYDDVNTTNAWKLLHRFTEIRIEHILSERVKEDKSLVDIRLSAGACKAFYTENIKDFILVSSDSDYFGLFEALSDCRFQVVAERDNLSSYAEEALPEYAYDFCYVDDFCTGKLEPLYVDALKLEINQFLEKKTFVDIKRLFSTAAHNARLEFSESELDSYCQKYSTDIHMVRNGDNLMLSI